MLRPVYDATHGEDGYVSLEVSPHLAHDTQSTISEAKRLRAAVNRPNLMIKVPATPRGHSRHRGAHRRRHEHQRDVDVLHEPLRGGGARLRQRLGTLRRAVQDRLGGIVLRQPGRHDGRSGPGEYTARRRPERSLGKIAIANSKLVYRRFREIFHGEGFAALRQRGARVQRPLWASTGTKNPAYSDVLYVENLIGPETVNTMPPETINAFRDHGKVIDSSVRENLDQAEAALGRLKALGIDLNIIAEKLQQDGVAAFAASFDALISALEKKRQSMVGGS